MANSSPHQEPFLSFLPYICLERGIDEPQDAEGREAIWNSLPSMNTVRCLGPIVKLMRWFSWFQTEKWYAGENFACKLLMLESKKISVVDGVDFIKPEKVTGLSISSNLTDKQELQQLKMKHGTWALGPLLVTPTSHFQKDLIALLANPCWGHHSKRAESVLTPKQVQEWISSMAKGGWKQEILDLMLQGFQTAQCLLSLWGLQRRTNQIHWQGGKWVGACPRNLAWIGPGT